MSKYLLLAATALAFAGSAQAATVYSNNFDTDNGGVTALNATNLTGLTVSDGTVDLVHTGDGWGLDCAGGAGGCVDLDGSTGDPGVLTSGNYAFAAGDIVTLTVDISGNQRGGNDDFQMRLLWGFNMQLNDLGYILNGVATPFAPGVGGLEFLYLNPIPSNYPYNNWGIYFTATQAGNVHFDLVTGGADNVGPIIDNVQLDVTPGVPEPATWAMMIGGFALAGAAMRRRKATVSFS